MNEDNTIDITDLDEYEVIAELHNGTQPQGLGYLHARAPLTAKEVRDELDGVPRRDGFLHFDYYHGRPLKVRVGNGKVEGVRLYDRDAGQGACANAVDYVRGKKNNQKKETA